MPDPLRTTFEEVAEAYDRARPSYPEQVIDELAELCRLREGSRIVEIGCGTGQATVPLVVRSFRVTAVELGENLAAIARRKLAPFPGVEVVTAAFETWEPREAGFDAVVAFTAFHWIDPEARYVRAAKLLRDQGALAVVTTKHVLPDDGDRFFVDVQDDYDVVDPRDDNAPPGDPAAVGDLTEEIEASGLFRPVATRRYLWEITYTADEYIAVLDTYSGHRALDPALRERLYERIHRRIEARPSRTVRKTYLAILNIAERD